MGRKVRKEMADRKDDGDEAPEEVTLGQGREEAEQLKKEEKESRRRVAAEAKARRKLRSGPKSLDVQDKNLDTQEVNDNIMKSSGDLVSTQKDTSVGACLLKLADGGDSDPDTNELNQNNQHENQSSLLDASVVQYLATREKRVLTTGSDAADKEERIKKKTGRKKFRQEKAEVDGANRVELLSSNDKAASYNAQIAGQFLRDRLYGSRVRRSYAMLRKSYRIPAQAS